MNSCQCLNQSNVLRICNLCNKDCYSNNHGHGHQLAIKKVPWSRAWTLGLYAYLSARYPPHTMIKGLDSMLTFQPDCHQAPWSRAWTLCLPISHHDQGPGLYAYLSARFPPNTMIKGMDSMLTYQLPWSRAWTLCLPFSQIATKHHDQGPGLYAYLSATMIKGLDYMLTFQPDCPPYTMIKGLESMLTFQPDCH